MKYKLPFTPTELYDRCLFASLVHAVANIRMPFMSYAVSWHGSNFSYQDGSAWGTVFFCLAESYLVGAAREDLSERTRWYPKFSAEEFLTGAPEDSKTLAERGLSISFG